MPEHRIISTRCDTDPLEITDTLLPEGALGLLLAALDDAALDLDYRLDGPESDYTPEDREGMRKRMDEYDELARILTQHRSEI